MKNNVGKVAFTLFLSTIFLFANNASGLEKNTLKWGFMTKTPAKIIPVFKPFVDWLAVEIGFEAGEIVPAATVAQMVEHLLTGNVDFYNDSPLTSTMINNRAGSLPFLMQRRKNQESYYSVIFARKDGMLSSINDLEGMTIAFENSYSSSGFLLPAATVLLEGLKLFPTGQAENGVAYTFSGSHENTVFRVLFNRVDAGATSDLEFINLPSNIKDDLLIIAQSPVIPRFLVSVRRNLPQEMLTKLKKALLNMSKSPEGQELLETVLENSSFYEIDEDNIDMLKKAESAIKYLEAAEMIDINH